MVSKAHVLSPNRPDFNDIMTLQASGVPSGQEKKPNLYHTLNTKQHLGIILYIRNIGQPNGFKMRKLLSYQFL